MRLLLFLASISILCTNANVIEQVLQYSKIRDHVAFTTPAEKSNMIIDELFVRYPNLKPETDKEIVEVKKSFMKFLDMYLDKRMEIIKGVSSQHTELAHVLKRLMIISKREFERLSNEEKDYLGKVSEYVIHKLCINGVWKVWDKKELKYFGNAAEIFPNGWTREEFSNLSMKQGAKIAKSWDLDPEEITKEWQEQRRKRRYDL